MGGNASVKRHWDHINAARKTLRLSDDEIPSHAITIDQYAERYKIPRKTAAGQLCVLTERGVLRSGVKFAGEEHRCRRLKRFYWPPQRQEACKGMQ